MSVLNSMISSLRSAFARLGRAIWRVIRPAPPLVIYLCVHSRMRPGQTCKNQCTKHTYTQTTDAEDIETTNLTGNYGYINQAIDISQEENQQEMLALSCTTAAIHTEDDVNSIEIQTQV